MRIGLQLGYGRDFRKDAAHVAELEKAGLDLVSVAEAYSFDAVSQLGYLAARTERLELTSGIMQLYSRTPTLTAMTAAGLDYVSKGRFTLGLGASGPQVVEGFHGLRYDAPLGRTRETIEICRQVWRRERVSYSGRHYQVPLPAEAGTGLGKPLKLINHPVRERIPVSVAAIGPKNVALVAEVAEGWEPIFFHPEKAHEVWGESLAAGRAKRSPELGELDISVGIHVAFTENEVELETFLDEVRPQLALYIGGMGARGKNFYHDLACRYGYEDAARSIQDAYLAGRKKEAAAAVPDDLVRAISLIGPSAFIEERLAALRAAGVTAIKAHLLSPEHAAQIAAVERLTELAA
ncbi:LLM class F420-dependent oxidoreductase [Streptosporangium sp. NPDC049644]|uniref:LLM class F420-dependent oxidoreductase n=1 Tax=Streptosporangium sp. NPDC049644 TaxID=3155507 RepID=UPI003429BFBE